MKIKHFGLGPEHPLNYKLQQIMITLFFAVWVIDSLSLLLFRYSSVLFDVISFPILILPAALLFIVGLYLITQTHGKVLVEKSERAKFIDSGVYSWVRHPMYLGGLLLFLSFFFISASLIALGIWIVFFIILNKMAAYEEKELVRILGKKYVNYQKRVSKWFPHLSTNRKIGSPE
jgi:protein-S-isoprenylcysteine O-methyltransferase Ste14